MKTKTAQLIGQNRDGLDFNENKYKAMCIERKNVICLCLTELYVDSESVLGICVSG